MKFLKQSTNIQYVIAKLTLPKSTCRPPQIPFHRGFFENQKKHGTSFQVTFFIECFDKDIFKKKVALCGIANIEKSQIFVLFENEASYEDIFNPKCFKSCYGYFV